MKKFSQLVLERGPLLYLVTDWRGFDDDRFLNHIDLCLQGGVDVVQFRDKTSPRDRFISVAQRLRSITDRYNVPLFLNDRVDCATAVRPYGVHVGKKDAPISRIRELLGHDICLGYSLSAEDLPTPNVPAHVDYVGVGPVFATKTKKDADTPMGLEGLRAIARSVGTSYPVIAIGGISRSNCRNVLEAGANGVAIIGDLMDSITPKQTAKELKELCVAHHRASK